MREPRDPDWPKILELANLAVDHVPGAPLQTQWLEHRRAFRGSRVHHVAECGGEVVGYAAIERGTGDPEATYRVFVVTNWAERLDVAERLWERVADELSNAGVRMAWLREYASDQPLIAFVRAKGFEIREEYEHDGELLVTLTREFSGSARAV